MKAKNDGQKIIILSLGQLVNSDMKKSIAAFSHLKAEQSSFPYFTTARIWFAYILDKIWYKTIDSYKLGNIDTEQFKARLSSQLSINNDKKFEAAWNVMCKISRISGKQIADLIALQQQNPFTLSIVSATNPLQANYIKSQIDTILRTRGLPSMPNPQIIFTTFFEEKELSLPKLAQKAIDHNNFDQAGNKIISLHNQIKQKNLILSNASFTNVSTDGKLLPLVKMYINNSSALITALPTSTILVQHGHVIGKVASNHAASITERRAVIDDGRGLPNL